MGKARTIASVVKDKSEEQREVVEEAQRESPLCYAKGHLTSQRCGVGTKNFRNTKAGLYSEVTV